MKKNTFSYVFFTRENRINKKGLTTLMLRITINGETLELSTQLYLQPDLWDNRLGKINKRTPEAKEINQTVTAMEARLNTLHKELVSETDHITIQQLKRRFLGKDKEDFPEEIPCG